MFDPTDYSAYCIEMPDTTRRLVIRLRGHQFGLPLSEAEALYLAIQSAFVRACDPTELPPADPPLTHQPKKPTKPTSQLTLEDLLL